MLDKKARYLQIAFNYDARMAASLIPRIPYSNRILIEAGTPFIKREGMAGIRFIRRMWRGLVVALGNAPRETLDIFIEACDTYGIISMIDMIGVQDPLKVIRPLRKPPDVVVLHLGRDEENTRGKLIQYRHVNRIRSKFSVMISAAGGVDVKQARSAIFNGANIVVANIVRPGGIWRGISAADDVGKMAQKFLETIE